LSADQFRPAATLAPVTVLAVTVLVVTVDAEQVLPAAKRLVLQWPNLPLLLQSKRLQWLSN
jgi:hypothetical protein